MYLPHYTFYVPIIHYSYNGGEKCIMGNPIFLQTDQSAEENCNMVREVMATVRMKKMGPRGLTRKEGGDG